MDANVRKQIEALVITRDEDYREICDKVNQTSKQLNARMDGLIQRFEELNGKILTLVSKANGR